MKKNIIRIMCITLALLTVFSIVSCNTVKFSIGKTDGDTYSNEFGNIKFTKPSGWIFASNEEIAQMMDSASAVWGEEEFIKLDEGSTYVFYAISEGGDSVIAEFKKGGVFTSVSASIEQTRKHVKETYEKLGWDYSDEDPVDVKLGSNTYKMLKSTVKVDDYFSMSQYCYFRMVGRYLVCFSCTAVTDISQAQFEAMFS